MKAQSTSERIAQMRAAPKRPVVRIQSIATEDLPTDMKAPFRLAIRGSMLNTARQKRTLKHLGLSVADYQAWAGIKTFNDFAKLNPQWSQRSWEVLMVENFGKE